MSLDGTDAITLLMFLKKDLKSTKNHLLNLCLPPTSATVTAKIAKAQKNTSPRVMKTISHSCFSSFVLFIGVNKANLFLNCSALHLLEINTICSPPMSPI